MKKKTRRIMTLALCVLFVMLSGIIAFAEGGHDTPVIPIHSHKYINYTVTIEPTCTQPGSQTGTCYKCSRTDTKEVPALGHLYMMSGTQTNEGVEIACRYCNETEIKTVSELAGMWGSEYINKEPQRGSENAYEYLDLDGNNIINAKDYAIIVSMQRTAQELNEE